MAAGEGVKVQLNFKAKDGSDLLNFYGVSSSEVKAQVEDFTKQLPEIAARFPGLSGVPAKKTRAPKKDVEEAQGPEPEDPGSAPEAAGANDGDGRPSASSTTTTGDTPMSPRERARQRLQGVK